MPEMAELEYKALNQVYRMCQVVKILALHAEEKGNTNDKTKTIRNVVKNMKHKSSEISLLSELNRKLHMKTEC